MPPMSSPPPRQQASASPGFSQPGRPLSPAPGYPGAATPEGDPGLQTGSITDFFAAALDGAISLVRADGGEIATLDRTRQVLVLRARRSRPRIEPPLGPMGAPGAVSQPRKPPLPVHLANASAASFPQGHMPALAGIDDETSPFDDIEVQSTQLLPAALHTRTFRKGERLIGLCWQRGEALIMRGDEARALPGGSAPPDADAPWHLAVPILRPSSLALTRPNTDIIGVISVYNKDPLWSFTARDVELLSLHADRVARGMLVADLTAENQSQAELLDLLVSDPSGADTQTLYARLRDVVRRRVDASSFAVLLYHDAHDLVSFEIAERDGLPVPMGHFPASALPPWWASVRAGHTVRVSSPEERALRPEYCVLGWGGDQPVQSLLAAPLTIGNIFLGAIVAGCPLSDVYAPEHDALIATIARTAAIVIYNARLTETNRQSLARAERKELQLSVLNNAVLTLNASLNVDETVQALATEAARLTGARTCAVFLFDETGGQLVGRAANDQPAGATASLREARLPGSWRDIGGLVHNGQFVLLDHLESEWEDGTEVGELLQTHQIRSCLILPLVHQEQALGALLAFTPGHLHHFTSEEVALLQGLGSQGAGAIRNAQLYEELTEAYEKQKELDRLKDDFILMVSHEFRTPVTAIEGYVTLIGRHQQKLDQTKLDQFAGEIRQATVQLMGMIDRLHDANSLDSQPLQLTPVPVCVRSAAEEAIAGQAPEAKARIMLDLAEDLWALADAKRLTIVFTNLLSNAIKYSHSHKPCQISARIEERATLVQQGRLRALAEGAAEQWVVVDVRDWGDGIAPDDQARLFQKFVRLSRSLTTSVRGTGLGLWICRKYLQAMGGEIWVESEPGQGSHFQFCLPRATAPAQAQTTPV
jgi:signal transduction histidine kinase